MSPSFRELLRRRVLVIDGGMGTSLHAAEVGCVVRLEGTLVNDADFGYGYRYSLLVEYATLEIE